MIGLAGELGDGTVLEEGHNAYVIGIVIRIEHGLLSCLPTHADLSTNSIS
jgi:hypothetical protein